jgi:hypothetical protein
LEGAHRTRGRFRDRSGAQAVVPAMSQQNVTKFNA